MNTFINKTIGAYEIKSEIGRGGMAVVYKAYQRSLDRYVALKILASQFTLDENHTRRFLQEAQAAAKLKHPNIVTVYDVGEQDGVHYIVMEFIEGVSLSDLILKQGALVPARAVNIVAQVASALDYAHSLGFVHRDVKPSNIMVDAMNHATLTDFGIVQAAEGARMTKSGVMVGTAEYMAPEQIRGEGVDARADVYALGIVCYEMLTGRVPFKGDTARVLHAHVYEPPPPLRSLNPRTPAALEQVVNIALAKDPARRYARAGEFANALIIALRNTFADSPASAPKEPVRPVPTPQPPKPLALLPLVGGAGGTFVILIVIVAIIASLNRPPVAAITSTSTATASATPTMTASATATETSTPRTPTVTPIPTYTPTPTPYVVPLPVPQGPTGDISPDAAQLTWSFGGFLREDAWFVVTVDKSIDGKPAGAPQQFVTKNLQVLVPQDYIVANVIYPSVVTFKWTVAVELTTGTDTLTGNKKWDPTPLAISEPTTFTWHAPAPTPTPAPTPQPRSEHNDNNNTNSGGESSGGNTGTRGDSGNQGTR